MSDAGWMLAGALGGGALAWFAARWRASAQVQQAQAGLREKLAAGEATVEALRRQLQDAQAAVGKLQAALDEARQARAVDQTRVEETKKNLDEQRRLLADAEKKFREVFTALSAESLKSSGEQFLKQAEQRVRPLRDALERYEKHIKELDVSRQKAGPGVKDYSSMTGIRNHQIVVGAEGHAPGRV